MKKAICTLLAILLCAIGTTCFAEMDLSSMTLEELYALRLEINNEIAGRVKESNDVPEGKTIAELFPDQYVARKVRDAIGAFSTKDIVSQEKLDNAWNLDFDRNDDVASLEGIQYLHNLEYLSCFGQKSLMEIPESIGSLSKLSRISIYESPITSLPDSICELKQLYFLELRETDISKLPEDIGNLSSLTYLDISYTKITSLPESIYALNLETFVRRGLDID